uniref:Cation efflux protein cytoplasmic domain-containing protein n=1 Tax=Araucaria cunninghamii TaxID=56994 RepID=A0A0D6QZ64_ARACU
MAGQSSSSEHGGSLENNPNAQAQIVEANVEFGNIQCGTGCGFAEAGNRAADAKERAASTRKLWIAVILCLLFMSLEVLGGIKANSLAVLTDAAHLLSDVAGFAISLFAIWASGWEATPRQTFGFFRLEILGALVSIQLIWLITGILVYEAIDRMINKTSKVDGKLMFIVATFGLLVNLVMVFLLGHDHSHGHGHRHGHDHGHGHGQGHSHGHDHWHEHEHSHDQDHVHKHGHDDGHSDGHQHEQKEKHGDEHSNKHSHQEHQSHHKGSVGSPHKVSLDNPHKLSIDINSPRKLNIVVGQNTVTEPLLSGTEHPSDDVEETFSRRWRSVENRNSNGNTYRLDEDIESGLERSAPHKNINVEGAYIHVLGDLIQSIGVMIGGAVIWVKPEWKIIDLMCTLFFSVLVLTTTIKMLRSILEVLMESTPREIDATKLEEGLVAIPGVIAVHELHIWAITVGKVLLACHVRIRPDANADIILHKVIEYCDKAYKISHVTVQIERDSNCSN